MTLNEYLNQKEPKRHPNVYVDRSEIKVIETYKEGNVTKQLVVFNTDHPLVAGITYILENNFSFYTMNNKRSVFSLKESF